MVDSVFFIGIGLRVDPSSAAPALGIGTVLLVAAVAGKVVGAGLPALLESGSGAAALLSISMIPRAEIALVVIQRGRDLGNWAVPNTLYGAMVFVSACTCLVAPIVLRFLFLKYPNGVEKAKSG